MEMIFDINIVHSVFLLKTNSAGDVCPHVDDQPENCRTCCCKASPGVDFYHPYSAYLTECGARDDAEYKVSLIPTFSDVCHPELPFPGNSEFSDLLIFSHHEYQVFSRAVTEIDDFYPYILYREFVLGAVEVEFEEEVQLGTVHDYFLPDTITEQTDMKRKVGDIKVTPYDRYVSLISTVVSTPSCPFVSMELIDTSCRV